MTHRTYARIGLAALLLLALGACTNGTQTPTDVQVNGYVVERDTNGNPTGRVEVGISAFDAAGNLVENANVRSVTATVTSVTTSDAGVTTTQSYTVTGGVCGDIAPATGPLAAVLMIDESGSMGWYDPNRDRIQAAQSFIAELRATDVASVARFPANTSITAGLKNSQVMAAFTSNKAILDAAVDAAPFAYGSFTPLWDAAHDTVTLLAQRSESNRVGIVLTDGENNWYSGESAASANAFARAQGVKLFALGFGTAVAGELDAMVAGTGGYRDLIDPDDPDSAIANLLDNIFAATQAQGCIDLTFAPVPLPGTRIRGSVTVDFDNTSATDDYNFRF